MRYSVYIRALKCGCEIVEAENEDEARQEAETLFSQHRISWHEEEIINMTIETVCE